MEKSRPDEQAVLDAKSKEVFMHNWLRRFERGEADPASHQTLSGERWQNTFRKMFQRTEAAPEKLDHTEKQYELRHEHKDVPAAAGLHVGAVVAGALDDAHTQVKGDPELADALSKSKAGSQGAPTDTSSSDLSKQSVTTEPTFPGYQRGSSKRLIISWLIVLILLVAIIALLSILL